MDAESGRGEIQRGSPRARRRAVLVVLVGAAAGAAALVAIECHRPALQAWLAADPARARMTLGAVFAALVLPLLGLAGYLWRWGGAIARAERFPPPGAEVVRDTPVRRGAAARRQGRLVQGFAAACALAAIALAALGWRLVALLGAGRP